MTTSACRTRRCLATTAVCLLAVPGAALAAKPVPPGRAFSLPSATHCLTSRTLTIRLRRVPGIHWRRATIKVNGRRVKTLTRVGLTRLRLPGGTIHLTVTAVARNGRRATAKRTYTPCHTGTAHPAAAPGSYSGLAAGRQVTFYVSGNRAHIQDVEAVMAISCTGSSSQFGDHIGIDDIPIARNGSFSATTTQQHGVLFAAPATYTYKFSGRFIKGSPSGTLREDITYDDGTVHHCTSNEQSWSATRDRQGNQSVARPPAGSFSGLAAGRAVTFYVSSDGKQLQDVVATMAISCIGSSSQFGDQLLLDDVAIAADGSFSATGSQQGVLAGAPATYGYVLTGHVHGTTLEGVSRIAGRLREDISYDDGTVHTCSSDSQQFSATRDRQGSQALGPLPAGSYSGLAAGRSVTFGVSGGHLTTVAATTALGCAGSFSQFGDQLLIDDIVVGPDGAFSATAHRTGTLSGHPAMFDSTFRGHTHGTTLAGVPRLAGILRENISYDDGTVHNCTTNDQAWSALKH